MTVCLSVCLGGGGGGGLLLAYVLSFLSFLSYFNLFFFILALLYFFLFFLGGGVEGAMGWDRVGWECCKIGRGHQCGSEIVKVAMVILMTKWW